MSYTNKGRRPLGFEVGDHLFLGVTPTTDMGRVIKFRKLTPRFIELYQIIKRIGLVAYKITYPPHLVNLHKVFHVSQLRKYIASPSDVLKKDDVQFREVLTVEVGLVRILNS